MFDSISFFRVIKAGFVNFWRNIWLSAAATMVMVITLIIFSVLILLFGITKYSVATIRDRVDISVYFKTGVAESLINDFKADLQNNPKVSQVTYTSAANALENFKSKHVGDSLILDSLAELTDNPLPATLQVKATNLDDYSEIAATLQNGTYKDSISKVNFEDNRLLIERLGKVLKFIVTGGVALVIIFSIIAILVIFNTITLTIYNRREEVEIMRLVGATNWYIRGPFLIESMLYSIVASAITAGLLALLFAKLAPAISVLVNGTTNAQGGGLAALTPATIFNLPLLALALLVVAVILSFVSSTLAIRKYLRV